MRQFLLLLLIALLTGCASAQPESPLSPLAQPAPATEEQTAAPSPLPQPDATRELAAADSAFAQVPLESRSTPSLRHFRAPPLSLREALIPLIAVRSAPLTNAGDDYSIFLPLVSAIDQRVLDARSAYSCEGRAISAEQCDTLLILFARTNGPNWKNKDGWLVDPNPCTWHGVKCSETESDKIRQLLLPNNGLNGPLPYEINRLPLTFLRLHNNDLNGSVPPTIALLSALEELRLENNRLTGSIPLSILDMQKLRWVDFSGNGSLYFDTRTFACADASAVSTEECEALVGIFHDIHGESWPMAIRSDIHPGHPAEPFAGAWLAGKNPCKWVGVHCRNGQQVSELSLSNQQVTGAVSPHFGGLPWLERLNLSNNQFSGPLPQEIRMLSALRGLQLAGNLTSLCIPAENEWQVFIQNLNPNEYSPPPGGLCP